MVYFVLKKLLSIFEATYIFDDMEEVKSYGLEEFIKLVEPEDNYRDEIIVIEISGSNPRKLDPVFFPLRLEAVSVILACHGEMTITTDYIPYTIQQNMVLERINMHLMNDIRISHDFKGYHILLGRNSIEHLFEEISTIPKEYGPSKSLNPLRKLDGKDFRMLIEIVERLKNNIRRTDHYFQRGIVMNETRNFMMELANIGMQSVNFEKINFEFSHHHELALRFMKLLVAKAKEWKEVAEYSTELCVTPVYLSRTVKTLSHKTAMEWINEARVGEAKMMLRKKGSTIQDIAEVLNFSDQSSFGKFFKKHTGMSPAEYKKDPWKLDKV